MENNTNVVPLKKQAEEVMATIDKELERVESKKEIPVQELTQANALLGRISKIVNDVDIRGR